MSAAIIQFHPVTSSFNASVLAAVEEGMARGDRPHATFRLHDGQIPTTPDLSVDELVVVYPTWWGGLPAGLLAWTEQVVGDRHAGTGGGPLTSVSQLTVVTTHGSSKFVNLLQGEPGRLLWKRTVLRHCRPRASFHWLSLYGLDRSDAAARDAFLSSVSEHFSTQPGSR